MGFKKIGKGILKYFLRGLLFSLPVVGTIFIIYKAVTGLDALIDVEVPGLGILIIISGITIIGYFASFILTQTLFDGIDSMIEKIPGVKFIYKPIKDMMQAFVGDKKKFTEPVMVEMTSSGIMKLGFITTKDLSKIGADGYVAVYFPHSYNFSGNLFLVPADKIKKIDGNSTELMKFIVSGGVTEL